MSPLDLALAIAHTKIGAARGSLEFLAIMGAISSAEAIGAQEMDWGPIMQTEAMNGHDAELGDVAQVLRGASGKVDRPLVKIEDSNPDRYVHIPVADFKTVRGTDTD